MRTITDTHIQFCNTQGIAIIDPSGLQKLKTSRLKELSSEYQLTISDCLLCEIFTKPREKTISLIRKLLSLETITAHSIGYHIQWEIKNSQPANILITNILSKNNPIESTRNFLQIALSKLKNKPQETNEWIDKYLKKPDNSYKDAWVNWNTDIDNLDLSATKKIREAGGKKEYIKTLKEMLLKSEHKQFFQNIFKDFYENFATPGNVPQ